MVSGNFVFYLLFHHISAHNSVTVFILFVVVYVCVFLYFKDVSIHNQWKIIKMKQHVRH